MEKYGIIYKTTCLVNGKIYIGQTTHVNDDKYLGSGVVFLKVLQKYGRKNFVREILRYCKNQKELDAWEMIMIKRYNSTDRAIGYNILHGTANKFGNGSCSKLDVVRSKISKSLTGKYVGDKNPNFGHYWSDAKKKELSIKNSGKKWSEEARMMFSKQRKGKLVGDKNPMYGKKHSAEDIKKISQLTKRYFDTHPEAKKKISEASNRFWLNVDEEWKRAHFKNISERKQKKVIVFTLDLSKIWVCKSYKEANKKIGKRGVSSVIRGITTHVNGFICRDFNIDLLKRLIKRKAENKVIKHQIGFNGKIIILEEL